MLKDNFSKTVGQALGHVYRFRRAEAVLDTYEELAKQEIYFSPPGELNDPMEGYKDVFWFGDHILWHNLFRHYLLCLLKTTSLGHLMGLQFDSDDLKKTIVFSASDDLPPVRAIYQRASVAIAAEMSIQKLIATLANRSTPLRRDALTYILRAIHPFALSFVLKELNRDGISPLETHTATTNETIARVMEIMPPEQELAEVLFAAFELTTAQMELIHDYKTPPSPEAKVRIFLARDFPASYVRALDELIHPPCFAACFVANPTDASMWGTYGAAHTGVCLKFKTTPDSEGRLALNLSGNLHRFTRVTYSKSYPEIDFFNSIGLLPIPLLNAVWYTGHDGERSSCRNAGSIETDDTDAWRKQHWEAFQFGACCKMTDWEHEQEYRLLLWSSINDLRDKSSRKLTYKFSDLSGIIFGAKTSANDKLKIMRIIEQKCRSDNRTDFEFHQAQYSRKDRAFKIAPLNCIRWEAMAPV